MPSSKRRGDMSVLPAVCQSSPGPGSFWRGRSLPCPSCVFHQAPRSSLSCTVATNSGRWRWWAEHEAQKALYTHRSQWHRCSFLQSKSFIFSQDLSMWKREELSVLAFLFFEVISINVTHVLWGCDLGFFLLLLNIFMLFFLKGPRKLMRKHSCKVKPVKWAVPEATSEGK